MQIPGSRPELLGQTMRGRSQEPTFLIGFIILVCVKI